MLFQLTRPRGTRLADTARRGGQERFNSRVRGGRDFGVSTDYLLGKVSTHASAGDATRTSEL